MIKGQFTNVKPIVGDLERSPAFYALFDRKPAAVLEFVDPEVTEVMPQDGPVGSAMVADPDGYLVELVAGDPGAVQGPPPGTKIPHPVPHIHEHA
ncbi:hypothetical protein [Nocardia sp. alder85J]|uniref:hypothetical protein n=1 Tax=Nocardia sp. alder85J TaxID=2862949 RepID=UPI001CD453D2|nr:hypothetical protein [Nocardia sp. alder85J]MCX4095591.1 hypothetical protein [Nocardia sp. alder85J]